MHRALLAIAFVILASPAAHAQIQNWQTGAVIPGTQMIVVGPGMQLSQWNTDQKNLRFADFSGGLDLNRSIFNDSWLDDALFFSANLENSSFNQATLTNAQFRGAIIKGSKFRNVTSSGFTRSQLATTASFQLGELQRIDLSDNDLSGWIFQAQDLTGALFRNSNLSGATFNFAVLQNVDFTGANMSGAKLWGVTAGGFTQAQLNSLVGELRGIELPFNDLSGWDFQGKDLTNALLGLSDLDGADLSAANLTNASLHGASLANANLAGAIVTNVSLEDTTSQGFTRAQLESTASFLAKDLQGVRLWNNNLAGWNFSGQNLTNAELGNSSLIDANFAAANLTNASLNSSNLTNADLTGADISGADLRGVTPLGLTRAQFESTANFLSKSLPGVGLTYNNLSGWNLSGQDLTGANLGFATLTNTNLSNAKVQGASFESATSRGFTYEQLASTASFKAKELRGISLLKNDLSGWDLSGQNFINAHFGSAKLVQTNLSFADMRGVVGLDLTGAIDRNMIDPNGVIDGFGMFPSELMVIRDDDGLANPPPGRLPRDPISVTVEDHFTMAAGSTLRLVLDANWLSVIGFEPGIAVRMNGTLDLRVATGTNASSLVGQPIRLFDWTGVQPTGEFRIGGPFNWDDSELYTSGVVRLAQSDPLGTGGGYDIADLNNVRNNFGGPGLGDYNLDGIVDIDDLNLVRNHFNASPNPVPEPHSLFLLAIGAAGCTALSRKRRRRT